MSSTSSKASPQSSQQRRRILLNLKGLFWCLHEVRQNYNVNLVLHSLERGTLHADIVNSHLGDNLKVIMETFDGEDLDRMQEALRRLSESRSSIDVGDKHFEVGHYIQAIEEFGPISASSFGIISAVTPELRGLFYFDDGPHLMNSPFAPSHVRVIFGTYVS